MHYAYKTSEQQLQNTKKKKKIIHNRYQHFNTKTPNYFQHQYNIPIIVSSNIEKLRMSVSKLQSSNPRYLGLDCEWKPNFKKKQKPNKIALLQIAHYDLVIIVRLNLLENVQKTFIQSGLASILYNKNIIKVGVGIKGDQNKLYKDWQIIVNGCIELNDVFRSIKWMSLKNLCCVVLNQEMKKCKKITLSNWQTINDLTPKQIRYAADDAIIAYKIYDTLLRNGIYCYKQYEINKLLSVERKKYETEQVCQNNQEMMCFPSWYDDDDICTPSSENISDQEQYENDYKYISSIQKKKNHNIDNKSRNKNMNDKKNMRYYNINKYNFKQNKRNNNYNYNNTQKVSTDKRCDNRKIWKNDFRNNLNMRDYNNYKENKANNYDNDNDNNYNYNNQRKVDTGKRFDNYNRKRWRNDFRSNRNYRGYKNNEDYKQCIQRNNKMNNENGGRERGNQYEVFEL